MRETREPGSRERRGQRAAEMQALRDAALFALVLGGAALINAVLGLALIEVFGSLEVRPTGSPEGAAGLTGRLGLRLAPTG